MVGGIDSPKAEAFLGVLPGVMIGVLFFFFLFYAMTHLDFLIEQNVNDEAHMSFAAFISTLENTRTTGIEPWNYQMPEEYLVVGFNHDQWNKDFPESVKNKFPRCQGANCVCLCVQNCEEDARECKEVFDLAFNHGKVLLQGEGKPVYKGLRFTRSLDNKRILDVVDIDEKPT